MRRLALLLLLLPGLSLATPVLLTTLDGQQTPFTQLQGKWVLINYWASWCQPCIDEISELNRFYQQNSDKIALFAVNYDGLPRDEQTRLLKKFRIHYPALASDPGPDLGLGDIRGVPVTFVFDPQGHLSDTLYGGQTLAHLNEAINPRPPH